MGAAIKEVAGIGKVEYDPGQDAFSVEFDPEQTGTEAIFAAVFHAGKKMGREYLPRLLT